MQKVRKNPDNPKEDGVRQRLKEARIKAGYTHKKTADVLYCQRQKIGALESGLSRITIGDLFNLARVYGVPPEWLLTGGAQ